MTFIADLIADLERALSTPDPLTQEEEENLLNKFPTTVSEQGRVLNEHMKGVRRHSGKHIDVSNGVSGTPPSHGGRLDKNDRSIRVGEAIFGDGDGGAPAVETVGGIDVSEKAKAIGDLLRKKIHPKVKESRESHNEGV